MPDISNRQVPQRNPSRPPPFEVNLNALVILLIIGKFGAIFVGCMLFAGSFFANNNILSSALAGLACFMAICSRLLQAEQHFYQGRLERMRKPQPRNMIYFFTGLPGGNGSETVPAFRGGGIGASIIVPELLKSPPRLTFSATIFVPSANSMMSPG